MSTDDSTHTRVTRVNPSMSTTIAYDIIEMLIFK